MALTSKKVVQDTPSELVADLRREFNALLVAIDTSTDYATLKSNVQTGVKKLITTLELPKQPIIPVV